MDTWNIAFSVSIIVLLVLLRLSFNISWILSTCSSVILPSLHSLSMICFSVQTLSLASFDLGTVNKVENE